MPHSLLSVKDNRACWAMTPLTRGNTSPLIIFIFHKHSARVLNFFSVWGGKNDLNHLTETFWIKLQFESSSICFISALEWEEFVIFYMGRGRQNNISCRSTSATTMTSCMKWTLQISMNETTINKSKLQGRAVNEAQFGDVDRTHVSFVDDVISVAQRVGPVGSRRLIRFCRRT